MVNEPGFPNKIILIYPVYLYQEYEEAANWNLL